MLDVVSMEWAVCSIINLLVAGYVLCEDKSSYSWKKIVLKGLPTVFWVLDDCYDMSEYLQKQYYALNAIKHCIFGDTLWSEKSHHWLLHIQEFLDMYMP